MTKYLLLLYAAISVYIGYFANDTLYFIGDQLNECLLLFLVAYNTTGIAKTIAYTLLILATFELIDEIAGRNTQVYWNDYIALILAAIYLLWKTLKKKY